MPVSEGYLEHVLERLQTVNQVDTKRMFGGVGIYLDGLFCALIADEVLYFKVDDTNRPDFEAAGMGPFKPKWEGAQAMGYYRVPEAVLEDLEALRLWSEKAMDVARRKSSKKAGGKSR
jgi:DNA transformation protein